MKFRNYVSEDKEKLDLGIRKKIIEFFKKNPNPVDSKIHALSDELGIDTHDFEEHIYMIVSEFVNKGSVTESKLLGEKENIKGGRAFKKGFTENDADKKQLRIGIKIEMEHTINRDIAKEIALDHLAEIPDYYTRLVKMEKAAGVDDTI